MKTTMTNRSLTILALAALLVGILLMSASRMLAAEPTPAQAADDKAADYDEVIRQLLEATGGAHVRLVWRSGTAEGARVMGLDTETRKCRVLLDKLADAHPWISPDGTYVMVNQLGKNGNEGCWHVDWATGTSKKFLWGRSAYATSGWVDPKTGKRWVVVTDSYDGRPWNEGLGAGDKVYRHLLSDPATKVLIWDKTPVTQCFDLSADGKKAGGLLPFNKAGVADLEAGTYAIYGLGCFASFATDNSNRLMHLEGNHRRVSVHDAGNQNKRSIPVNTMPLVAGQKPMWHSRWANNTRFLVLMGPEGGLSQIYFGRFDEKWTAVEQWVQVTNTKHGNGMPSAWVASEGEFKPAPDADPAKTAKP